MILRCRQNPDRQTDSLTDVLIRNNSNRDRPSLLGKASCTTGGDGTSEHAGSRSTSIAGICWRTAGAFAGTTAGASDARGGGGKGIAIGGGREFEAVDGQEKELV